MDINGWLVISGRGEDLTLGSWNRGIAVNQLREDPTHGFNPQGQWRNVQQNHVFNVPGQDPTLNGSP